MGTATSLPSLALALLLSAPCPPAGSWHSAFDSTENVLKNRTGRPRRYERITIRDLLRAGPSLYRENSGAEVEGLVVRFDVMRPEACNCFDPDARDLHIALADRLGGPVVVTEVTPRRRVRVPAHLLGRRVRVRGWLFFDVRHPKDRSRGTAWEIHPVTSITVLPR